MPRARKSTEEESPVAVLDDTAKKTTRKKTTSTKTASKTTSTRGRKKAAPEPEENDKDLKANDSSEVVSDTAAQTGAEEAEVKKTTRRTPRRSTKVATKSSRAKKAAEDQKSELTEEAEKPPKRAEQESLAFDAKAKDGAAKEDGKAADRPEAAVTEAEASDNNENDSSDRDSDERDSGTDKQRSNKRRNFRGRNNRKTGLNFKDLQSKLLPELHLMAKEAKIEDYRQLSKDDLVEAILEQSSKAEGLRLVKGYLEISSDGYGFLQESLLQDETRSVIVSAGLIKQFKLRTGDIIMGKARHPRDNERYGTLIRVEAVNKMEPFEASKRPRFDDLTPTFPQQRMILETKPTELSARVIDLLAPIGRGQRGLIVAPPKAGKTTLLKQIANAVVTNEPDIHVIVLLVDERPEEVTDFRESVHGVQVIASTFDEPPTNHIRVAEFVHERARRIVEDGGHAMILLDSITRLARANNLVTPPTGRTLSGGLDSSALHWPKRFLGAARNIRGGGSLSILATALVETGSRMDDVIFEEFKGTGNMELHLSRRLEERRIFPAIDILKSGTRREDLLIGEEALAKMWLLRKVISDMDPAEAMEMLLSRLSRTQTNDEFLSSLGQG